MERKSDKPPRPDDEIRQVVTMTRAERAALKGFASRIGESAEAMCRRWLMERLAQEERKRDK
jgi:hypothetical protein